MRLGEFLGALSLATDLAAGLPLEASLRTCVLATRLARLVGVTEPGALGEVRRAIGKCLHMGVLEGEA